jgi:hypothetical protein
MAKCTGGDPGAPRVFKTPKELADAITKYFKSPPIKTIRNRDNEEIQVPILTITGLCLELGFCSRQSFYDYEKTEGFSYIIKRARTLIEHEYEVMLQTGNTTGAIFALKQFGWSDKQEIEQHTTHAVSSSLEERLTGGSKR